MVALLCTLSIFSLFRLKVICIVGKSIRCFCILNEPQYSVVIIIIIIIKKGWQYKARRERLTPDQSDDPNPTTPTQRMKEDKGKTAGDKR